MLLGAGSGHERHCVHMSLGDLPTNELKEFRRWSMSCRLQKPPSFQELLVCRPVTLLSPSLYTATSKEMKTRGRKLEWDRKQRFGVSLPFSQ